MYYEQYVFRNTNIKTINIAEIRGKLLSSHVMYVSTSQPRTARDQWHVSGSAPVYIRHIHKHCYLVHSLHPYGNSQETAHIVTSQCF